MNKASNSSWWSHFPGGSLVAEGLADFTAGNTTPAACLISIASPRLLRHGILKCCGQDILPEAELVLYETLCQQPGDAYSRYNSLLRELVSFEHALDHLHSRQLS